MSDWKLDPDTSAYEERLKAEHGEDHQLVAPSPEAPEEETKAPYPYHSPREGPPLEKPSQGLEDAMTALLQQQHQMLGLLTELVAPNDQALTDIDPLKHDRASAARRQCNTQLTAEAKERLAEIQKMIGARTRAGTLEYAIELTWAFIRKKSR